jgi:hypothetical protein
MGKISSRRERGGAEAQRKTEKRLFLYFIPPQQCAHVRDKKALLGRNEMGVSGGVVAYATLEPLTTNSQQRG